MTPSLLRGEISRIQEYHRLNCTQMALILGMGKSHYSEFMTGARSEVSKKTLIKLRQIFKLDLNKLIDLMEDV